MGERKRRGEEQRGGGNLKRRMGQAMRSRRRGKEGKKGRGS